MKCRFGVALTLLAVSLSVLPAADKPLRIFISVSGQTQGPGQHDYPRFLADWKPLLEGRGASVDGALRFPTKAELAQTDVLLIYAPDANRSGRTGRALLESFVKRGGGLVALHDAVCGTNAGWMKNLVGGAKAHGETNWSRGSVGLYFGGYQHPITKGVSNFDLDDQSIFNLEMMPGVKVIASTFHPTRPGNVIRNIPNA